MNDNIKEATGYVAWCPVGCGWRGNLSVTQDDAQASLDHHMSEQHPDGSDEQ